MGFVPLIDCAPLAMAEHRGLFVRHGLRVDLQREPGWATIRDKIVLGEIDAAHAIAGLAFAITAGVGTLPRPCQTSFLFNANGDAITLSKDLADAGVRKAADLAAHLPAWRRDRPCTFAVVHAVSSHHFLLRGWLQRGGLVADQDVRIVVLPPPLMVECLEAGHIDGFCVGEPYNTLAVERGVGTIVAASPDLSHRHPEKALLVRSDFARRHPDEHEALIAALQEACVLCDDPANHAEIASLLAGERFLDLPPGVIANALAGTAFPAAASGRVRDLHVFARHQVNRPSIDKGSWLLNQLHACGLLAGLPAAAVPKPSEVFREPSYDRALGRLGADLRAWLADTGQPAPTTRTATT